MIIHKIFLTTHSKYFKYYHHINFIDVLKFDNDVDNKLFVMNVLTWTFIILVLLSNKSLMYIYHPLRGCYSKEKNINRKEIFSRFSGCIFNSRSHIVYPHLSNESCVASWSTAVFFSSPHLLHLYTYTWLILFFKASHLL